MHSQDNQRPGKPATGSASVPVLKQTSAGWTIHMAGPDGENVLNLAVFPTKFLAEEALARMVKRQAGN